MKRENEIDRIAEQNKQTKIVFESIDDYNRRRERKEKTIVKMIKLTLIVLDHDEYRHFHCLF